MWGTTYISTVSMYDYPTVTIEQPLYVRLCITFTGEVAPPPAPSRPRYPAAPGRSMMMTTMTVMIMVCGFSHRGPHSPVRPMRGRNHTPMKEQGRGDTALCTCQCDLYRYTQNGACCGHMVTPFQLVRPVGSHLYRTVRHEV